MFACVLTPTAGWQKLLEDEVRIAKQWGDQENVAPAGIASRLGRSKTSMTRLPGPREASQTARCSSQVIGSQSVCLGEVLGRKRSASKPWLPNC